MRQPHATPTAYWSLSGCVVTSLPGVQPCLGHLCLPWPSVSLSVSCKQQEHHPPPQGLVALGSALAKLWDCPMHGIGHPGLTLRLVLPAVPWNMQKKSPPPPPPSPSPRPPPPSPPPTQGMRFAAATRQSGSAVSAGRGRVSPVQQAGGSDGRKSLHDTRAALAPGFPHPCTASLLHRSRTHAGRHAPFQHGW